MGGLRLPVMATATLDGTVIANADTTVVVEGNHYFPPDSIDWQYLTKTELSTVCPWKGSATYYDVAVGDTVKKNAAWTYTDPKEAASEIKDHVAFYPDVAVSA